MLKSGYVYIITNQPRGTLYTGVTNNLERRVYEHKNNLVEGFTSKYDLHSLVYFDTSSDIGSAIEREKQIKSWNRIKKIKLIEESNPEWNDLSKDWFE